MQKVFNVYKPIGKTPLEMIYAIKKKFPEYKKEAITYAGRLDPLARGVLILLAGDAIVEKKDFLLLEKTYEFEALLGIQTDTYDVLGMLQDTKVSETKHNVNAFVNTFVKNHLGKQTQSYPPFSSKTVQGKPLFAWAKEGRLDEIEIPQAQIAIDSFEFLGLETLSKDELSQKVFANIKAVNGDFRQEIITKRWEKLFANAANDFQIVKCRITCSSGTYVRGIVNELGKELGCGAIALDILRIKVGKYSLEDSIKII